MKTDKQNVLQMTPYIPGYNTQDIILSANENPYNLTLEYMDEIIEMLRDFEFNRYPDSESILLKQAYAKYCGQGSGKIVCGNGSDEIIRLVIEAYVDNGENIVVHDPTFSMYEVTCNVAGGNTIKVQGKDDFSVSADDIIQAAFEHSAKLIFMCNPNNPTGNVFTRDEIKKVIEGASAVVVVDEAYIEFGGESVIDLVSAYDNLLVLRTLSKAFGLCGLRIGFGIGSKDIIDMINRVKAPYNLNQLSQNIGVIALSHADKVKGCVLALIKERDRLEAELEKNASLKVYGSYGNFIYVKCDAKKIKEALNNRVSLRYFGEEYVRISVGTKDENNVLLELLGKVM